MFFINQLEIIINHQSTPTCLRTQQITGRKYLTFLPACNFLNCVSGFYWYIIHRALSTYLYFLRLIWQDCLLFTIIKQKSPLNMFSRVIGWLATWAGWVLNPQQIRKNWPNIFVATSEDWCSCKLVKWPWQWQRSQSCQSKTEKGVRAFKDFWFAAKTLINWELINPN